MHGTAHIIMLIDKFAHSHTHTLPLSHTVMLGDTQGLHFHGTRAITQSRDASIRTENSFPGPGLRSKPQLELHM